MTKVLNLDDHRPHLQGFVKCLHCGHTWQDKALIGEDQTVPLMECPKCSLWQGHFMYSVLPNEGENVFTCGCGSEVFFIIKSRGHRCVRCGFLHTDVSVFGR